MPNTLAFTPATLTVKDLRTGFGLPWRDVTLRVVGSPTVVSSINVSKATGPDWLTDTVVSASDGVAFLWPLIWDRRTVRPGRHVVTLKAVAPGYDDGTMTLELYIAPGRHPKKSRR